jgi:predicted PolB exonuclease-like 3'-5' exonuclease
MTHFKKPEDQIMSNVVVFDIETVPLREKEYAETQQDYIEKKLAQHLKKDPELNAEDERNKIKSLDPLIGRIACIGMYYPDTALTTILMDENEELILKQFWNSIAGFRGVFVSFNGQKFDCPYIVKRSMLYQIEPTNRDFLKYTAYNPLPEHFDVMLQVSGRDGYISLEQACNFFGVPSPKDGDIAAKGVQDAFYNNAWDHIKEYCERDLIATNLLYQKTRKYVLPK